MAVKLLAVVERKVRAEKESGLVSPSTGPITVRRYAERWLQERRARGVAAADGDASRLAHALPLIGDMALAEVRPRHILNVVRTLEAQKTEAGEKQFAPRTILHVYGALRVMFSDALTEELIAATPCVLKQRRGELPKKLDRDPTWRREAVFSREEVMLLVTDRRIPERHRVLYALENLGGMRVNEISPRKWRDYLSTLVPLGKLVIDTSYASKRKVLKAATKTGVVREMPVHPALASILADWHAEGWARQYGRQPGPEDFIVPSVDGGLLSSSSSYKRLQEDLAQLGLRRRRQHDARRTFISLAIGDGARKELLRWVTHGPEGDVVDAYTTPPWHVLCEQVSMLKFPVPEGVRPSGSAVAVTPLLRQEKHSMKPATSAVEAEGIEPSRRRRSAPLYRVGALGGRGAWARSSMRRCVAA
ncbi:MAG: hypothetical protein EOO71_27965 [Myxococcaceae bacterium]|nr:MAG: hypothetical protein EOO71_27965 [Myxococcaceae bacterium]